MNPLIVEQMQNLSWLWLCIFLLFDSFSLTLWVNMQKMHLSFITSVPQHSQADRSLRAESARFDFGCFAHFVPRGRDRLHIIDTLTPISCHSSVCCCPTRWSWEAPLCSQSASHHGNTTTLLIHGPRHSHFKHGKLSQVSCLSLETWNNVFLF